MSTSPNYGYATVEEIMATYGVTRAYVYKMASKGTPEGRRWGRYRHPDGGVRYRREDVDDTLRGGGPGRLPRSNGKVRDEC